MSIFEVIGYVWVVFASCLTTVGLAYFAWHGLRTAWRQRARGQCEEVLDIRRSAEDRYLIERAGRQA